MNKSINIFWTADVSEMTRAWIEQLISDWTDFAYGYDIEDEAIERICEVLDELDISYSVEENDV